MALVITKTMRQKSAVRFAKRVAEILSAYTRVRKKQLSGNFVYVRKRRKSAEVPAHVRPAHFAWILVRDRTKP